MPTKEIRLLTLAEVAATFRCDPETVRRWVKSRKLPAVSTPGGGYRVRSDDIEKILGADY
jgi:excisionase family DNA binding protein